jgi:N-acetylglucosamine kinase-like BadF-type ATPase
MKYYAGLDIGGTTGRIRLAYENGESIGEYQCGGSSIHSGGEERAKRKYQELVLPILEENALKPEDCTGICVAASGIDSESLRALCKKFFTEMGFPEQRIFVFNDCEIFLQAYDAPSIILVAGTGSITFGMDKRGRIVRTGGWGHILSDEGSGFNIGMRIVKAIGDHLDKRTCDDILYKKFYEVTGIDDLEKLSNLVNHNIMTRNAISNLAPLASQAAAEGSLTAQKILLETAEALFQLIWDNYRKMELQSEEPVNVIFWGSVLLKNQQIRRQIERMLNERLPQAHICIPEYPAVKIALEVAQRLGADMVCCVS